MAKKIITSQFSVTSVDDGRDGDPGENGTSPWVADFDNEMDSVQCDDSGYVLEEQTVYTNVRLFYGNNAKMLTIVSVKRGSVSMGNGTEKNGVIVTWGANSSSVGISFKYKTTAKISGKDNYEIVLRSYDGESQNKTLYFTVNGVRGDVYNLLPAVNEIHATRDANGNYLVNGGNTFVMTCGYSKRNLNGNVTRVTDVSGKIDNKYNIYFNRHKRGGDWAGNWALYQNYKYALAMPGTTIGSNQGTLNPKTYDAIRFALCESTSDTVAVSTGLTGIIDEETVCIIADGVDGKEGSSPWFADINNEMDSVCVDAGGKVVKARNISTQVFMYHGSSQENFTIESVKRTYMAGSKQEIEQPANVNKNGVTVNYMSNSGGARSVGVTYAQNCQTYGIETFEITIKAVSDTSIIRTLNFTVNPIRGNYYSLIPSEKVINASRNENDDLVVNGSNTFNLECSYNVSDPETGIHLFLNIENGKAGPYNVYSRLRSRDNQAWGSYSSYGGPVAIALNTYDAVEFIMCTDINSDANTIIDRETVYVVADGIKGEKGNPGQDAVVATVSPDKVSIPCSFIGVVEGDVSTILTFTIKKGSLTYTPTSVEARSYDSNTFDVDSVSGRSDQKMLTVKKDASRTNLSSGVTFDVTFNSGNVNITAPCTVSTIPGSKGEPGGTGQTGHVGRWYEYAGRWGRNGLTSVTNSKHVGYFVKYVYQAIGNKEQFHYYINIKDDGVANTTTPANQEGVANEGWEQISDERIAIFTKVIFSENAYLGSFIFNNDWMISQQAAAGSPSQNYSDFNEDYPNINVGDNFIPVLAMDGRTGKVYMNDAVIRGNVYAENGYFKGGLYSPLLRINDGNISNFAEYSGYGEEWLFSSFPENCGGVQFEMSSDVAFNLPYPDETQNGRELEIVNLTENSAVKVRIKTTYAYGAGIVLKQYGYIKFKVVYDPVGQNYIWMKIGAMNIASGLASGDINAGDYEIRVEYGQVTSYDSL